MASLCGGLVNLRVYFKSGLCVELVQYNWLSFRLKNAEATIGQNDNARQHGHFTQLQQHHQLQQQNLVHYYGIDNAAIEQVLLRSMLLLIAAAAAANGCAVI